MSSGDAGSIDINTTNLSLLSGGRIEAISTGTGTAGEISVVVGDTFELISSAVTTEALSSDGGDIVISVDFLLQLTDSTISTSVGSGEGAGGNIAIDPVFVILFNSSILANAFGGPGGNISIVTEFLFIDPVSTILASSQLGVSGTVTITSTESDVSAGLTALPESFLDASTLLAERCAARRGEVAGSLAGVGRGGMPTSPDGMLPATYLAGAGGTGLPAGTGLGLGSTSDLWMHASAVDAGAPVQLAASTGLVPVAASLTCSQ